MGGRLTPYNSLSVARVEVNQLPRYSGVAKWLRHMTLTHAFVGSTPTTAANSTWTAFVDYEGGMLS